MTRVLAGIVTTALATIACAGAAQAELNLRVDRMILTNPFAGSTVIAGDGEGLTAIPVNNTLWLGDDAEDRVYEVDRASGALLSRITKSEFASAVQLGGTALAGTDRAADIEALAYDPGADVLYVFSTDCCPHPAAAFRLVRASPADRFQVETFQPLPSGFSTTGAAFTGAGFHPVGGLYVSVLDELRQYDYVANTLGPPVALDPKVTGGLLGFSFSPDGNDLWVVTTKDKVYRVDWATKQVVPGYEFDLWTHGINDGRAVEFINGQVYVIDGFARAETDPRRASVTVFTVVDTPATPSGLTAVAGSNRIDLAWTDNASNEAGFRIERCAGTEATTCGISDSFALIASVEANVTAYADTTAADGQTFTYRVRAFDASGLSAYSNAATATAGAPAPPSDLFAIAVSGSRISLLWTDNASNETGFAIERCLGPAASCEELEFAEVATVGADVTSYVDFGLDTATYSYRVRTFNGAGTSAAAGPATATTLPPTNLLANPGFEDDANADGKPDAWTPWVVFTRSSEVVRNGLFAGKHSSTGDVQYTIRQHVGVNPGTSYAFFGCANIPASADVFDFKFHLRWLDAGGAVLTQKTLKTYTTPTDGAWDCVSASGLVAPTGASQAEVRMVTKSLALTIYVDQLVFEVQ